MTTRQKIERLTYALAIALSLIVLAFAILASSYEVDTRVVYQGF